MTVRVAQTVLFCLPFAILAGLAYLAVPTFLILDRLLPSFHIKNLWAVCKHILYWGFTALILIDIYLASKHGQTPLTIAFCIMSMYGMFYFPYMLFREAKKGNSLFSIVWAWLCVPISVGLFVVVYNAADAAFGFPMLVLVLVMSVFCLLHSIVRFILIKLDCYYDTCSPKLAAIIQSVFAITLAVGFLVLVIVLAAISMSIDRSV